MEPGQTSLLTLVAHYDSKRAPEGFVGATDSAAPCAMLLHVAKSIDQYITRKHLEMAASGTERNAANINTGIQILLIDGEEAFSEWSDEDSLYGSR